MGSWAPPPTEYFGTTGSGASVTVNGHGGGTADIAYVGDLAKGSWGVDYHHYSADGKTFVDGSYKLTGDRGAYWTIDADIKVTGRHTGSLGSNLILDSRTGPLPKMTGQFTAVYDGKKAPALPKLGPCYKKLPQKSRLQLKVHRKRGNRIVVRVTANVYGDRRPVRNAIVKSGRRKVRTNGSGQAVLKLRGHGRRRVVARAGFTFKRDVATVRLR